MNHRILVINYEFPPLGGGAGNASQNLAGEMVSQGAEVVVLSSAFKGLPKREIIDGYQLIRTPTIRRYKEKCRPFEMLFFMVSSTLASIPIHLKFKPTAIITFFGIPSGPTGWFLKTVFKTPYIISLRGGDVPGFQSADLKIYHKLLRGVIRFLWKKADAVIANSKGLRRLALETAQTHEVLVIENGVDANVFVPPKTLTPPTAQLNAEIRLLFVGRIVPQKGLDILLQALRELKKKYSFKLVVVGAGDQEADLKKFSSRYQLEELIDFAGWVTRDQLPSYYARSDIFVLPSRAEGMSNAVLEAMASRLAVVTTNIAGNEELIVNGHSGLLVEPDRVSQLVAALGQLFENPRLRRQLGVNAREQVVRKMNWQRVASKYIAVINSFSG